jgi:hypothetical protein
LSEKQRRLREIALAAARNDVDGLNSLLIGVEHPRDLIVAARCVYSSVFLTPFTTGILEVAAFWGSVEVFKLLVNFFKFEPDCDTFSVALAGGDLEMVRLVADSLGPCLEPHMSVFLRVASEYHRTVCLRWLASKTRTLKIDLLFRWLFRKHPGDAVLELIENGLYPWSDAARRAASEWPLTAGLPFGPAPAPFIVLPDSILLRFSERMDEFFNILHCQLRLITFGYGDGRDSVDAFVAVTTSERRYLFLGETLDGSSYLLYYDADLSESPAPSLAEAKDYFDSAGLTFALRKRLRFPVHVFALNNTDSAATLWPEKFPQHRVGKVPCMSDLVIARWELWRVT